MWWEIVPAASLVLTCLTVPCIVVPSVHYLFMGKPNMRGIDNTLEQHLWRRDQGLDPWRGDGLGNGHNVVGLEGIPDGK